MDEIFGDPEKFSGINVAFDVVVRLDDSNESFRLVSVNGFRHPSQFKTALNLILEKTEKETWSVIGKLPAEDIRQFLSELILRYARLKNLVSENSSRLNDQDLTAEPRPEFYLFDQRIVKNDVEPGSMVAWPTSVPIQASEFFSTRCRENVSWQSLKNQMDSPGSYSGASRSERWLVDSG
jgi:hypothetical protein